MIKLFPVLLLVNLVCFSAHAVDAGIEALRESGKAFSSVAKSVSPSVVFVQVEGTVSGERAAPLPFPFDEDFFKRFFGDAFPGFQSPQDYNHQPQPRIQSQGSGFVFSVKDGLLINKTYIMTNNHVVEGADNVMVKFMDGHEYQAEITGRDPQSDVAVIEINTDSRPALKLGDSSKLDVGEWVVAIGNPFGLSHTLTVGVVSATGRTSLGINDYEDFIQTDAAINVGNSGGPLVNLVGEVIGMNTAIFTRSGGYMGIGFAIPINMAKQIAMQLIDKGEVSRSYLGIVIQPLTTELAKAFGLRQGQGILVAEVVENSPADRAGLQPGDVIIAFRGEAVSDIGAFRNQVSMTAPGTKEELTIIRDGKRKNVSVTLAAHIPETVTAKSPPSQSTSQLGLTVQTLSAELAKQFNARAGEGVVVTEVKRGSVAALAGINVGTIILQVNHKSIATAEEFAHEITKADKSRPILLLIRFGEVQRYVSLDWRAG
ncbi:MAG: DegQ family serine endoprotease [Gammaproteobacteria bacterium]|nr:DegQ family serine endoprotease [Gammaproteobacteria bacterium]